ncbi:MAG: hypothetical protein FVQ77_12555 [Cytophagales bacterium]|nr:hypothetical protein [Cytophagales bacterium]
MKKPSSILLLGIFTIMLLPWQLMCMAHPMGHTHHHAPGELSPCEQRRLCKETSFWPPMDCNKLSVNTDDYQLPQNGKLISLVQTLLVATVLPELIEVDLPEDVFIPLPDPKCHSGPPPSGHLLRAPPSV